MGMHRLPRLHAVGRVKGAHGATRPDSEVRAQRTANPSAGRRDDSRADGASHTVLSGRVRQKAGFDLTYSRCIDRMKARSRCQFFYARHARRPTLRCHPGARHRDPSCRKLVDRLPE